MLTSFAEPPAFLKVAAAATGAVVSATACDEPGVATQGWNVIRNIKYNYRSTHHCRRPLQQWRWKLEQDAIVGGFGSLQWELVQQHLEVIAAADVLPHAGNRLLEFPLEFVQDEVGGHCAELVRDLSNDSIEAAVRRDMMEPHE